MNIKTVAALANAGCLLNVFEKRTKDGDFRDLSGLRFSGYARQGSDNSFVYAEVFADAQNHIHSIDEISEIKELEDGVIEIMAHNGYIKVELMPITLLSDEERKAKEEMLLRFRMKMENEEYYRKFIENGVSQSVY